MKIDLHVHTAPRSACSHIPPEALVAAARGVGLDGLCLTEHQVLWSPEAVQRLAGDSGLVILRGNEITTAQGDVLVFGFYEDIQGVIPVRQLFKRVEAAGGFSILAHPFRGFKVFGIGDLHMSVEQACQKKALEYVHAVEIANGKVRPEENRMAADVAARLDLPGTGGSDAHNLDELGLHATEFEDDIRSDADLVRALRAGRFSAV